MGFSNQQAEGSGDTAGGGTGGDTGDGGSSDDTTGHDDGDTCSNSCQNTCGQQEHLGTPIGHFKVYNSDRSEVIGYVDAEAMWNDEHGWIPVKGTEQQWYDENDEVTEVEFDYNNTKTNLEYEISGDWSPPGLTANQPEISNPVRDYKPLPAPLPDDILKSPDPRLSEADNLREMGKQLMEQGLTQEVSDLFKSADTLEWKHIQRFEEELRRFGSNPGLAMELIKLGIDTYEEIVDAIMISQYGSDPESLEDYYDMVEATYGVDVANELRATGGYDPSLDYRRAIWEAIVAEGLTAGTFKIAEGGILVIRQTANMSKCLARLRLSVSHDASTLGMSGGNIRINLKKSKYPKDYSTRKTSNQGGMFSSEGEARQLAREKLGKNPVYIGDNKWRSRDGRWQYRAKPVDTNGRHIHLERLDPNTGEVIENWHLYWGVGTER